MRLGNTVIKNLCLGLWGYIHLTQTPPQVIIVKHKHYKQIPVLGFEQLIFIPCFSEENIDSEWTDSTQLSRTKILNKQKSKTYVDAESRIKAFLESAGEEGVLQSEIHQKLGLSKSTVSEILSWLENGKEIVRKKVSGRSYRVWLSKYSPGPVEGLVRVGILKSSEYPKVVAAAEKVDAIIRVYDSSIELTKDLVHGHVDIAASPFVTQAFFGVLMKTIKIVRKIALNGSGVIFSNDRSEWWACSEFSTMERNLRKYMEIKGSGGMIRFFKSPEDMINSLNELRGIAIWEPYFTMMEDCKKESFNEVLGDYLCCTLAVNTTFSEVNYDLKERFLREFDRAKVGGREAELLSEVIGFSADIIKKSFESYIFDPEQSLSDADLKDLRFGGIEGIVEFE